MHPILNIATKAARNASKIILRSMDRLDSIKISRKEKNDFVTEVDQAAEREIINTIHASYPNHGILAEESGSHTGDEYTWIIDPLDGTTNYIHGLPHFAISIAVKRNDSIEHALIYDPLRQDLFSASKGAGTVLNSRKIRVSNNKKLEECLLGTGFPYSHPQQLAMYLKTFTAIFPNSIGVRRCGSAALDLAYVAAGYLDGFWEFNLNAWDIAAGALLIKEAGGFISDFQGEDNYLTNGNVIAGNPKIHKALLDAITLTLQD